MRVRAFVAVAALLTLASSVSADGQDRPVPDKAPVDASKVDEIWLFPPEQSGWIIRFRPDGSAHAQYGSGLGDAAKLPKGSVDFGSLLKAAYRLKSDKGLEQLSTISVSFKDGTNTAFSVKDDTLFRYLIDSFDKKWEPELGGTRFDTLRRKYPIYKESANADQEKSSGTKLRLRFLAQNVGPSLTRPIGCGPR
jgi:hypothetical protein